MKHKNKILRLLFAGGGGIPQRINLRECQRSNGKTFC